MKEINSNYEINSETLAIISLDNGTSKIIEKDYTVEISCNHLKIIDNSCKYFGSSYTGRFEGTKNLIKTSYKNPIIIEESREIVFFPTTSPRLDKCCWISLNNIKNYEKNIDKTRIYFENNKFIDLDISYKSFDNQYLRATHLLMVLKKQKTKIK